MAEPARNLAPAAAPPARTPRGRPALYADHLPASPHRRRRRRDWRTSPTLQLIFILACLCAPLAVLWRSWS